MSGKKVHSDLYGKVPLGYVVYYLDHWKEAFAPYAGIVKDKRAEIEKTLESAKWGFANNIMSTHKFNIPKNEIDDRLRQYVRITIAENFDMADLVGGPHG